MAVTTRVILPYKSHMLVNAQARFFIWIFHEKKKGPVSIGSFMQRFSLLWLLSKYLIPAEPTSEKIGCFQVIVFGNEIEI